MVIVVHQSADWVIFVRFNISIGPTKWTVEVQCGEWCWARMDGPDMMDLEGRIRPGAAAKSLKVAMLEKSHIHIS